MCSSVDLPAPEGAQQSDHLAGPNGKVRAIEDFQRCIALPVSPLDLMQEDNGALRRGHCLTRNALSRKILAAKTASSASEQTCFWPSTCFSYRSVRQYV